MTRDDDGREGDDTTSIAGGQRAWSTVGPQGPAQPPLAGDPPPEDFAGPWQPQQGSTSVGDQGDNAATGGWDDHEHIRRQWDDPERGGRSWEDRQWDSATDEDRPGARRDDERDDGRDDDRRGGRRVVDSDPAGRVIVVGGEPNDGPAELTSGHQSRSTEQQPPPGPVLVAQGLGLLTKAGWVFQNVDLTLRPGSVAAIVGPAGTGRSCLLLALSGRMEASAGRLMVAGHLLDASPASIRSVTAVARIGSLTGPEAGLTVRESIDEQCLVDNVDAKIGRTKFVDACAAMGLTFDPSALVGTLAGAEATLFAVALACVRVSAVIMLDDLDRGVSAAVQQTMVDVLIRLAATGPAIVLSTTDRIPVMDADVVLDLTPDEGSTSWQLPSGDQPVAILRQLDPGGRQRDPLPQLDSGSFAAATRDARTDPDGSDGPTEFYRLDEPAGQFGPDQPSGPYGPQSPRPYGPDWPAGQDGPDDLAARYGPQAGRDQSGGFDPDDGRDQDRPDDPGTPNADAPTKDNR